MRVLLLEHDEAFTRVCTRMLNDGELDCRVTVAASVDGALRALETPDHWDVMLADLELSDSYGLDTIRTLVAAAMQIPVILLTGSRTESLGEESLSAGAQDFLSKESLDSDALTRVIRFSVERAHLVARVRRLCLTDPLTGLANRRLLHDRSKVLFAAAQRRAELVTVIYLDIDRFKGINDSGGHALGDLVLQTVASTLQAATRTGDSAARLSGDEFCIVAAVENQDSADGLVTRVANSLRMTAAALDDHVRFTVSIGASVEDPRAVTPDEAMEHADQAMYDAKSLGPGRVRWHSRETQVRRDTDIVAKEWILAGINHQRFRLLYQPVLTVQTGTIDTIEALLRLTPDGYDSGIEPPQFLESAERLHLMPALGQVAVERSIEDGARLRQSVRGDAPRVAINLSTSQASDPNCADIILAALHRWSLPSDSIVVELTEEAVFTDDPQRLDLLRRLARSGIAVTVDNFGVGTFNLIQLTELPISSVKIDRTVVATLPDSPAAAHAVQALCAMTHRFGVETVAAGVETPEQLRLVTDMGVRAVQGFLVGKPTEDSLVAAGMGGRGRSELLASGQAHPRGTNDP
jgi:diguanylate cyclase (GGDEF)-like protein